MSNYFSKFSLEEVEGQKLNINKQMYRRSAGFLTLLLYLTLFFVVSINFTNDVTNMVVKGIIIVVGFGLHVYCQFRFSKNLTTNPTQPTTSNELNKILKEYEPKIIYFALFLGLYFVSHTIQFPFIIIYFVVFLIAIVQLYRQLKNDAAI